MPASMTRLFVHCVWGKQWPTESFKWQDGYGAFTVNESTVPTVRTYIANQQAHHHTFGTCEQQESLTLDHPKPIVP